MLNYNEYGNRTIGAEALELIEGLIEKRTFFRYAQTNSLCDQLETALGGFFDSPRPVLAMNGTAALRTALLATGIGPGDYVLVNSFTFIASASAIRGVQAIPIPIDFDPITNLDLKQVDRCLEEYPVKAIMPVHWPGQCFDLTEIKKRTDANKLVLIEDACQAFGAQIGGQFAGFWGDIGVFSFQQNKQISSGEGGVIVSKNKDLLDICRSIVDHGAQRTGNAWPQWSRDEPRVGENFRMSELQAALLLPQVRLLPKIIASQRAAKAELSRFCETIGLEEYAPQEDSGMALRILFDSQQALADAKAVARSNQIQLKPIWTKLIYDYPAFAAYRDYNYCPTGEQLTRYLQILPIPPFMDQASLEKMKIVLASIKTEVCRAVL